MDADADDEQLYELCRECRGDWHLGTFRLEEGGQEFEIACPHCDQGFVPHDC